MATRILPGDPDIAVTLRRSSRARRMTLRVGRVDGAVTLTLPPRVPEAEGLEFARARENWLRGHLSGIAARVTPAFGTAIPLEGRMVTLMPGPVRAPRLDGGVLILPDDADRIAPRLVAFLRMRARERLAAACDRHAAALGRGYGRTTLRDTRSRWGSCSSRGDLMFSWRLILAPPEILDYVAAHEVAHLAHMDHSPAFWAACARLYPDWRAARDWLRRHGGELHALRFD